VKGQPFAPDARMRAILEKAAQLANGQMRVQSFADRSPGRVAWSDRRWEWATLRSENGTFDAPSFIDLDARAKWFFQAQVESPAMFRRTAGAFRGAAIVRGSFSQSRTRTPECAELPGAPYATRPLHRPV